MSVPTSHGAFELFIKLPISCRGIIYFTPETGGERFAFHKMHLRRLNTCSSVGRIVAAAAAKHLTPCTLELGGQSPVIVDDTVDVKLAAKRIIYGKAQNSGQLCVAPNHVFVLKSIKDEFIKAASEAYKEMWPHGSLAHKDSFGRIITPAHYRRLEGYLNRTKGQIAFGGAKEIDRGLELTLVNDVAVGDSILEE